MNNEEPDEPFKDLPFSSKLLVIASLFIIIAAAIGGIAGGYFFGIKGLFSILGVTYESDKTLLFFILGCFGAGLIIEPFIKLFSMFVYHLTAMKKTAITRLVFYFIGNVITINQYCRLFHGFYLYSRFPHYCYFSSNGFRRTGI